jgi:CubicO group peptidase (beta-lactamase class C family)
MDYNNKIIILRELQSKIMRLTPGIAIAFFSGLLVACHSDTPTASARTNKFFSAYAATPTAPECANATPPPLAYDTTSNEGRNIIARLDNFYRAQARAGFNGGVLVGYNGRVIYERYFGYSNREHKIPLSSASSCQLASVSKTFTGTAILYLHERKIINIDYPVQYYIKEFPYQNISLRMLLNHRSGLPDYTHWVTAYDRDTRTPISNEMVVKLMAEHKPHPEFKPNSRFKYSNTNYALLASVIERVSGTSFADFMAKNIFEPLGMEHTFVYNPSKGLPAEAAISYKYNWLREPDMFADGVSGDKGIYSTPSDMYRWDQSFYNHQLLSPATIEMAYTPYSHEKKGIKNYGLGWRMLCYPNGNKVIYHNGWWHGNNTSFYRLINDKLTIIVLGNKFNNSIYHHAPAIYNIVKGEIGQEFDTGG